MNRPALYVVADPERIDLRTLRHRQFRVHKALLKAQRAVDDAIARYVDARKVAVTEGVPIDRYVDEKIVEGLTHADAMIRTVATLRAAQCPDAGQTLENPAAPVDEER